MLNDMKTDISSFQESHNIQCPLNIWDLVFEAGTSPLGVDLHELILTAHDKLLALLVVGIRSTVRDHLLEALHRSINFGPRGDIVFDLVNKWSKGYASWIR